MALYPLRAPRNRYQGNNPARRQKAAELSRLAERVVAHINSQMEQCGVGEWRMFTYGGLAYTFKTDEKDVEAILQELGGGGNGITVVKRDQP